MKSPIEYYTAVRLRSGVEVSREKEALVFNYRHQGCRVVASDLDALTDIVTLLQRSSGLALAEMRQHPFAADVADFLLELDRLGLITEAVSSPLPLGQSGTGFMLRIQRTCAKVQWDMRDSALLRRLKEQTVTAPELRGYAVEYFHITRRATSLLAPLESKYFPGTTPALLRTYINSERDHDELLQRACAAMDVLEPNTWIPLPETEALCATLGAWAYQDPLSVFVALFLFEQPASEFHQLLETNAARLRLPEEFFVPIQEHAHVNDDGDHGDISSQLLGNYPFLAEEEQVRLHKNVLTAVELQWALGNAIATYYERNTSRAASDLMAQKVG